ncbi:MAG: HAMP domain-containing histidine kinase [Micrococcales bacterium]|nr:HAMP domain-containing histidine kinase [Micrococcales bacterium]
MSAGSDPEARPVDKRRPSAARVPVWVLVVVAPTVVGVVVALVRPWDPRAEIIRVSTRLVTAAVGTGVMVSLLFGAVIWAVWARRRAKARHAATVERAVHTALAQAHADARTAHQRFLSRLDHEMKNPVTAIRASVDALRASGVGFPVAVIDTQSARIAALVSDLRKLADLETAAIEMAPVAMEHLVADVVAMIDDELATDPEWGGPRSIRTELPTVPWRVPDVAGDVDLLFLAMYNVVHNAVKYSAPGATVVVRGMEDSGGVLLEVADTGQGIPADEVADVWDELKRASNVHNQPGSGLGLALVRTIVERHGGRVQLSSRLGEGTSVRLWLPFARPGAATGWNTGPIPRLGRVGHG